MPPKVTRRSPNVSWHRRRLQVAFRSHGLNTTGHEIGGSLGVAVLVTVATGIISAGASASTATLANGLGDAFMVSGVIAAAAGVVALFVLPSAASFLPKLRLAPRVAVH